MQASLELLTFLTVKVKEETCESGRLQEGAESEDGCFVARSSGGAARELRGSSKAGDGRHACP